VGNDENPGTLEPFASLQHARYALRQAKVNMKGDSIVYLRGGTHRLGETGKEVVNFNLHRAGITQFEFNTVRLGDFDGARSAEQAGFQPAWCHLKKLEISSSGDWESLPSRINTSVSEPPNP
jgi:hypothetical protein